MGGLDELGKDKGKTKVFGVFLKAIFQKIKYFDRGSFL